MIYECEDIIRTIDDHIDEFENLWFLLKEKNGFLELNYCHINRSSHH